MIAKIKVRAKKNTHIPRVYGNIGREILQGLNEALAFERGEIKLKVVRYSETDEGVERLESYEYNRYEPPAQHR